MKIESFLRSFLKWEKKFEASEKKGSYCEFMKPSWQHGEKKVIRI